MHSKIGIQVFVATISLSCLSSFGFADGEKTIRKTDAFRPQTTLITPDSLPKPFATPSANRGPSVVAKPDDVELQLPPGFKAEIFAEGLNNPRSLAVAPNGDLFVVESGPNRVTVLRDSKGAGKADFKATFAEGLNLPFGIVFLKDSLFISNTDSVVKFSYAPGQTKAEGTPTTVLSDIPGKGYHGHWARDLVYNSKTDKMYLSIGSEHDLAEDPLPRATITEFNPDGSGRRIFASGIRNPSGKAINPANGELWTTVNERDGMGDDLCPDYVTSVKDGGFYGFPYYYAGQNHDPRMPEKPELKNTVLTPDILVTAHSAALGIAFYTGKMFPKEYRGDAFVALHGSANRSKRTGYKIIRIPFKKGKPVGGYQDFCSGWMLGEDLSVVWGRPVGVAVGKDGSLFISDDGANRIWRIFYKR